MSRQVQAASEQQQLQALGGRGRDWAEGSAFEVFALLKIPRIRLAVDGLWRACQFELVCTVGLEECLRVGQTKPDCRRPIEKPGLRRTALFPPRRLRLRRLIAFEVRPLIPNRLLKQTVGLR